MARAVLDVEKNGQLVGQLYPRRDFFFESQQPMTIPGVRSTMEDDLYVLLVDWLPVSSQGASFKVYHNPLVNWLWLGGAGISSWARWWLPGRIKILKKSQLVPDAAPMPGRNHRTRRINTL